MALRDRIAALLGVSAYTAPPPGGLDLDSPQMKALRRSFGGQLSPQPQSQTRWYLDDLEAAVVAADAGFLAQAARLMRDACSDGVLAGVLSTRTGGLVRLPKWFRGDEDVIAALELGHEDTGQTRSVFDEMFPAAELELLERDGVLLGVGVAEMCEVQGRDYPVMVRRDPEFLVFRWSENRWYFRSIGGLIPITPGDGRWILHTPGGREAPWQNGLWRAVGAAYIRKTHAKEHKDNWEAKLANPARVAVAPNGSTDTQVQEWVEQLMAWGVNTVFGLRPGYDAKLLESNGVGHKSFDATIKDANDEMKIAVTGQTVTTDGGAGFQNSDIHKSIRADLISKSGDGLAYTINTQGIPPFVESRWGIDALVTRATMVEWDVTPPKDREAEADSLGAAADALSSLDEALERHGREVDIEDFCAQFGIRTRELEERVEANRSELSDAEARVARVERRAARRDAREAARRQAHALRDAASGRPALRLVRGAA